MHISCSQQTLCKRGHHSYTSTFRQTNVNSLFWNPLNENLKLETIYTFIFQQVNFNSLHISWFQQTLCKRGHHSYTPTFRQTNINSLFWNPLNGNLNLETIYTSIFHQQNLELALLNPNFWLFYTLFWKMFRGKRKSARRILR